MIGNNYALLNCTICAFVLFMLLHFDCSYVANSSAMMLRLECNLVSNVTPIYCYLHCTPHLFSSSHKPSVLLYIWYYHYFCVIDITCYFYSIVLIFRLILQYSSSSTRVVYVLCVINCLLIVLICNGH